MYEKTFVEECDGVFSASAFLIPDTWFLIAKITDYTMKSEASIQIACFDTSMDKANEGYAFPFNWQ